MAEATIRVAFLFVVLIAITASAAESVCHGRVGEGRIVGAVKLPEHGRNFEVYSSLGAAAGRTYVHTTVRDIVVVAYASMWRAAPGVWFVYGESGRAGGGRFWPHRTHQNGLSVDFMMPVRDERNRPATFPRTLLNEFGYALEFDDLGRTGNLQIDFGAVAEHLYQLDLAAQRHGTGLALVIFDDRYLPLLFATARGEYLRTRVHFMKGKPWIRHDEHYHVDFAVRCRTDQ